MISASIFGGKTRCCYCYTKCVIILLYLFLLPQQTYPQSQPCFSSCGKISTITYPFRLKHDPIHCGNNTYELECMNNVTVLKLFQAEYLVESINYNNYTIRVVDPNIQSTNCSSLPRFFLYHHNFTYNSYHYRYSISTNSEVFDLSRPVIYMKCTSPPSKVVDRYYADTASCLDQHTYVIVGDPQLGILEPQCRVKFVTLTSFWGPTSHAFTSNNIIGNISYVGIHKALGYGFEISWMQASCPCDYCYLNDLAGEIHCYTYNNDWRIQLVFFIYDYIFGILRGFCEVAGMNKFQEYSSHNRHENEVGVFTGMEKEMEDVIMEEINDVLKKMFIVALWCIQLKPIDRPSMNKVVEMLEGDIENIEIPPKPLLYPHETSQENLDINSNETVSDVGSTSYVEEIATNPLLKYSG
ncbi:rust resistance kinase Lr10 [Trifolium repens]|nr:rust resistance kinase Lr10 [Trifolium repens]